MAATAGLVAEEIGLEIERRSFIDAAAAMRIAGGEVEKEGLIALGLSLACLAGAWTWTLWPAPPPVNLASDYSAVAEFTRLQKQPDGVWSGELAEDWSQLDPAAQQARCDAIAEGLTGGEAGTVVLQSADEVLLICGEGQ